MRLLLASAGLFALQACSVLSLEMGEALDVEACAGFEPGLTRRAEVLESLGPPSSLGTHADGVAFLYEHVVLHENQFGISLNALGVLFGTPGLGLLKVALGKSGSEREAAVFLFDAEGRLTGVAAGDWEELFGKGGGLQTFFAVEQVVDARDLRRTPPSLSWGRRLLDPLPRTLNRTHVPDLELRGAPNHAGQRTLELRTVGGEDP